MNHAKASHTWNALTSSPQLPRARHILGAIRRTWKTDRVHGLPAVAAPTFSPSAPKNNDTWWVSQDTKTVYLWDSMDNQDRQNTLEKLKTTSEWTIWKTRCKGQGMVTSPVRDGLPPAPQHTQRQGSGMVGIQGQGMVTERRHSNHESQEVLRMLGENFLRCTNRGSEVTYGDVNGTTVQCRERYIHR